MKRRKVSTLFGRGAVEFCSTSVLVVAGTFAVATTASLSDTIDVTTPCPAAVQAFDSEKRAGQVLAGAPSPHVQEVGDYIMGVIAQLDGQYMKDGKSGIWADFSNLILDVRWSAGDATLAGSLAKTLVAQKPDVILTETTPPTEAVLRETNSIPIVFAVVSAPVGSGFVKSLQRPGGNATGFMDLESTFAKKWVELLKEIAPNTQKAAVMFNPQTATYVDYYLGPMRDVGGETWREAIN